MKALSLWQPWASLVALRAKRCETRHWATTFRGPLAIHAAKRWTQEEAAICFEPPFRDELTAAGLMVRPGAGAAAWLRQTLPFGAIVATCQLVTVIPTDEIEWQWRAFVAPSLGSTKVLTPPHEEEFGDYSDGRFAWVLGDIRRLAEPIPLRGQQGLWELDAETVAQITAQGVTT